MMYALAIDAPPPSCSEVNIRASPPRKFAAKVMMLSSPVLFACRHLATSTGAPSRAQRPCYAPSRLAGSAHLVVLQDLRQPRSDVHKDVQLKHRAHEVDRHKPCAQARPAVSRSTEARC